MSLWLWCVLPQIVPQLLCAPHSVALADDEDAPGNFHRGNKLLHAGDIDGAELAFRRAAKLIPTDPAFYVNLGAVLARQDRRPEAEATARVAINVAPAFARTHYALGQILAHGPKGGRHRDALRRLARAASLAPRDADLQLGVGNDLQHLGSLDAAQHHFFAAARLRPDGMRDARKNLGCILAKLNRLAEARAWLEEAMNLAEVSSHSPAHITMAKLIEVLLWLGDYGQARKIANKAVDVFHLWTNPMQRPTIAYRPELFAKPWWSVNDDPRLLKVTSTVSSPELVEELRMEIAEVKARRPGGWRHQPERIQDPQKGHWKEWKVQDERGKACRRHIFPRTCTTLHDIGQHVGGIFWGQYSVLEPGAHIRPHSGPTNDRLTLHLCISSPANVKIRVGETETREYRSGAILFFDDSFEHEAQNLGNADRVVLMVQFAHPGFRIEEDSLRIAGQSEL